MYFDHPEVVPSAHTEQSSKRCLGAEILTAKLTATGLADGG